MLKRSLALTKRPDVYLAVDFAHSCFGADLQTGIEALDEAVERAEKAGDAAGAALARAMAAGSRLETVAVSAEEVETLARDALPKRGHDLGAEEDPVTQSLWRQVTALVAAHREEHAEAERLAREALTYSQQTDSPQLQGDAYYDLAEVLHAAGHRDEAVAAWHEARDRYERKGIIPLARRTRERLSAVQETPI